MITSIPKSPLLQAIIIELVETERVGLDAINREHLHDEHERHGWYISSCLLCVAEVIAAGDTLTCDHGKTFGEWCTPCEEGPNPVPSCPACVAEER